MSNDVNEFALGRLNRLAHDTPRTSRKFNSQVSTHEETTKQSYAELKALCDTRNNEGILEFFKSKEDASVLKAKAEDFFHFAVLQLTCNDDHESLEEVLDFGQQQTPAWEPQWKEEKDVLSIEDPSLSRNPIMIASQQGFHHCAKLLFKRGYRIPQVKQPHPQSEEEEKPTDAESLLVGDKEPKPGEEERYRQKMLMENENWEDQVGKFLAIQAFAKPYYLSLGFTEDSRIENFERENLEKEDDIKDLEKLDPLRRAFKLSEYAENTTMEKGQTVNLAHSYLHVKEDLENFSRGVLTTCHNMAEVELILEHTPEKTKDIKSKQQNFKKALTEGRVDFVSHPYFQEYFNNRMTGKTGKKRKKATKTGENEKKPEWESRLHQLRFHQLIYLPYAVLLFCFYPFVVFADLFRDADIIFEKEKKGGENWIFAFFRKRMHTPYLRQNVRVAVQCAFLLLIVLMMWNPIDEAKDDTDKEEHRFICYMVLCATAILFLEEGIDFLINQGRKGKGYFFEDFWDLFSLGSRFVLLVGLSTFLIAEKYEDKVKNRALYGGDHVLNVSFTLVSLGIAGEFFKVLRFLLLFQTFGPLVICVINCVQDAAKTVAIYAVIFCTFAIFAWGMLKPFHRAFNDNMLSYNNETDSNAGYYKTGYFNNDTQKHNHTVFVRGQEVNVTLNFKDHTGHPHMGHTHTKGHTAEQNSTAYHNHTTKQSARLQLEEMYDFEGADAAKSRDGLFHRLFWNMFSAKDQAGMHIKYNSTGKASHRFTHSVLLMSWALYQVIMAIIMINLLIAIMNNTFSEVWQTADKRWKYSRSYYQAQFLEEKSTFPPPFQWIYYIARFVHWCKKASAKGQDVEAIDYETKLKYLRLLKKLITIKQQKELETTGEDSLADLREDLKQDMKLEIQDMKHEIKDLKQDIQKILEKIDQLAKHIEK